jgi:hypothetical protein
MLDVDKYNRIQLADLLRILDNKNIQRSLIFKVINSNDEKIITEQTIANHNKPRYRLRKKMYNLSFLIKNPRRLINKNKSQIFKEFKNLFEQKISLNYAKRNKSFLKIKKP